MLNIRQDVPDRILQNLNNRIITIWNFSNVIFYKKITILDRVISL